jgi:uncharacterized protein
LLDKPAHVFDRDREWAALASFVQDSSAQATLGLVSGRRRQGKTFLLDALGESAGGFYFAAAEAAQEESLRQFGAALGQYVGANAPLRLDDWTIAIGQLFQLGIQRPLVAVIDEFPYLVRVSPALPSLLQRELDGPAQARHHSRLRLLICGSAMSVMGKLLAGPAPLRGRASLELMVQPLGYRDAARFWDADDPKLAVLLHAIVGGTPAYRRQFVRNDAPDGLADLDAWVARTVLDPTSALFREARYLLAEETDIREPALYHSVLAAVASGSTTWGGIATYLGRRTSEITHVVTVLEDAGLLGRDQDAFRSGRARYRITEPLLTFYHNVMRGQWTRLELGQGEQVWRESRARFLSQVVGPHFEQLCRTFALTAGSDVFGEPVGEVASGVVNDAHQREQVQVDVVVFAPTEPGQPRRILSLGEAKWGEPMGERHLARLRQARNLLAAQGYDTRTARLACYSGAGFDETIRTTATTDSDRAQLVGLNDLYA